MGQEVVVDLATRLAARGLLSGPLVCDEAAPRELRAEDGSKLVHKQMESLAVTVIAKRTRNELREVCRLRGISTFGSKDVLIRRLMGKGNAGKRARRGAACCERASKSPRMRRRCCQTTQIRSSDDGEQTPPRRPSAVVCEQTGEGYLVQPATPPRPSPSTRRCKRLRRADEAVAVLKAQDDVLVDDTVVANADKGSVVRRRLRHKAAPSEGPECRSCR